MSEFLDHGIYPSRRKLREMSAVHGVVESYAHPHADIVMGEAVVQSLVDAEFDALTANIRTADAA